MKLNLQGIELTEPEPGFNILRKEPQFYTLIKHYPEGLWKVTVKIKLEQAPTQEEAQMLSQKMDRIHNFHSGQALGFLLATQKTLAHSDNFNPAAALDSISRHLKVIKEDLDSYVEKVQRLKAPQVELTLDRS